MHSGRTVCLALVGVLASARPAAQGPMPMEHLTAGSYAAHAVAGARIAAQWCDSCHMVENRQGRDVAPPFAVIAARRSPAEIRAFLTHPHGGMPPIELSNSQIDDVIAYMKSLDPE